MGAMAGMMGGASGAGAAGAAGSGAAAGGMTSAIGNGLMAMGGGTPAYQPGSNGGGPNGSMSDQEARDQQRMQQLMAGLKSLAR